MKPKTTKKYSLDSWPKYGTDKKFDECFDSWADVFIDEYSEALPNDFFTEEHRDKILDILIDLALNAAHYATIAELNSPKPK